MLDDKINKFRSIPVFFNVTEQNNNFGSYTDFFDDFSIAERKYELKEILCFSDNKLSHLQHETLGPRVNKANIKLGEEKSSTDGYVIFILGYARSPFRDVETCLRNAVGLDEDDIQMILKRYNSFFLPYDLSPAFYTIEDNSEAVHNQR